MTTVFEQKNTFKVYLQIALPLVLSCMVSMFYNIADTYFISYAQDPVLVAGVSLCGPLLTVQMAMGNLMAQGGTSLLSRLLGEKNIPGIRRVSSFCFYTSLGLGVLLGAVLLIWRGPILALLGADAETMRAAGPYYTVIAIASPLHVLNFVPTNMLRAEGFSREVMIASLLSTLVNLILDPLFILVLGMGAFGAALATAIGYVTTNIFCIWLILKKSQVFSLRLADIRCSPSSIRGVFAIGASAALTNVLMAFSQAMYNQALLTYGSDKIAAMGIALKIFSVPNMIIVGFAYAAQPVFGYFYGAGNREKLVSILKQITVFIVSLAAVLCVAVLTTSGYTVPLFLQDSGIVATGKTMLFWQTIGLVLLSIMLVVMILLQALGKATQSLILSLTRQGLVFMLILQVNRFLFGYEGIIRTQAVSDVAAAAIAVLLFLTIRRDVFPGSKASTKE
ncbi:MAG: MATE family efflux transporter [Oscillospiraceae bacterium]|nr:MATE family efflux transporter [Oscillospiraceae bacterium]